MNINQLKNTKTLSGVTLGAIIAAGSTFAFNVTEDFEEVRKTHSNDIRAMERYISQTRAEIIDVIHAEGKETRAALAGKADK